MAIELDEYKDGDESWADYSNARETIPAGEYKLAFVDAEERISKNTGDKMVNVSFVVRGGDYDGEMLFQLYLLGHSKDSIRRRNMRQFGRLCVACGVPDPKSTAQLQAREFIATVSEKDDGEFGWKNEIKGYAPIEGIEALQAQEAQQSQQRPSVTTEQQYDEQPQQKVAHEDLDF